MEYKTFLFRDLAVFLHIVFIPCTERCQPYYSQMIYRMAGLALWHCPEDTDDTTRQHNLLLTILYPHAIDPTYIGK